MSDRAGMLRLWVPLLSAALLAGCGGDKPTKPKPVGDQLSAQSTPQNVLKDLAYAYSNRDSVEIKSVYDSTYTGVSTDETQPPGSQILNFTYADEVGHVAAMARAHSITSVLLNFGNVTRLGSNDISHPEWATIQISGSNMILEIDDAIDAVHLASAGITESFSFKPITPDSSSPTDTTWKIVRWSEVYVGGP